MRQNIALTSLKPTDTAFSKVWIEVRNGNREIEFHDFLEWMESLYGSGAITLNGLSCEMIGDELYAQIIARYPNREIWIEVSEDGENGSLTRYPSDGSGAGHDDLVSSD
jgi:hypothetical protein